MRILIAEDEANDDAHDLAEPQRERGERQPEPGVPHSSCEMFGGETGFQIW